MKLASFSTSVPWIAAFLGNGARGKAEDVFTLGFEGPDVLTANPGEKAEGIYASTLSHSGPGPGAQGWSTTLVLDNASLEGIAIGLGRDARNYPWLEGRTTDAARLIDHLAEHSSAGFWQYGLTLNGDGECEPKKAASSKRMFPAGSHSYYLIQYPRVLEYY